jgi:hypothetical protein
MLAGEARCQFIFSRASLPRKTELTLLRFRVPLWMVRCVPLNVFVKRQQAVHVSQNYVRVEPFDAPLVPEKNEIGWRN